MKPQDPEQRPLFLFLYDHVSGVLSALAVAAFVGHFVDFDWRGALAQLFGVWDSVVRPVTSLLLDATIVRFCNLWFHWHLVVPAVVRDYISAGLVLSIAAYRAIDAWSLTKALLRVPKIHFEFWRQSFHVELIAIGLKPAKGASVFRVARRWLGMLYAGATFSARIIKEALWVARIYVWAIAQDFLIAIALVMTWPIWFVLTLASVAFPRLGDRIFLTALKRVESSKSADERALLFQGRTPERLVIENRRRRRRADRATIFPLIYLGMGILINYVLAI